MIIFFSHCKFCITVVVPVEEQANVGEPFITHRWDFLSPRIGGLGTEGEGANVDLATPLPNGPKENLRSDQEVPFSQATPVILELGVSPEASETDRGNSNCFWDALVVYSSAL